MFIKNRFTGRLILLAFVLFIGVSVWHFGVKQPKPQSIKPMSVNVTTVKKQAMPVVIMASGVIVPAHTVAIKSQVTGAIRKVHFKSGSLVLQNQLLFELDPENFIAQVKQAEANLSQDMALLTSLRNDVKRYSSLVKNAYVSKQQYEQALASYNAQRAKIETDQQDVKQAKISLDYTNIRAPISGKTGNVNLKAGDLVKANDGTAMVIINQIDPIEVDFNISQHEFSKVRYYHHLNPIIVNVWNEGVNTKLASGTLNFIDNQINSTTGNILLKTDINNTKHLLWPGEFVTIKLIVTMQPDAVVIPANAVHTNQQGHFVYLVKNNRAIATPVTINRQIDNLSVVSHGLKTEEQVITLSAPNIKNNAVVKIEKHL